MIELKIVRDIGSLQTEKFGKVAGEEKEQKYTFKV